MAQVKAILHYIDAILLTSAGQIPFLPYDEGASSPCVAMSFIFIFFSRVRPPVMENWDGKEAKQNKSRYASSP